MKKTAQSLGIKENCIKNLRIVRRSVDARKKDIKFVYSVDAEVESGLKYKHSSSVTEVNEKRYIPVKALWTQCGVTVMWGKAAQLICT